MVHQLSRPRSWYIDVVNALELVWPYCTNVLAIQYIVAPKLSPTQLKHHSIARMPTHFVVCKHSVRALTGRTARTSTTILKWDQFENALGTSRIRNWPHLLCPPVLHHIASAKSVRAWVSTQHIIYRASLCDKRPLKFCYYFKAKRFICFLFEIERKWVRFNAIIKDVQFKIQNNIKRIIVQKDKKKIDLFNINRMPVIKTHTNTRNWRA